MSEQTGPEFVDEGRARHAECSRGYAGWVADSTRKPEARELPLVMGRKIVGVTVFDGEGGIRGTVTDPAALSALGFGDLPPMSIATRPQDWAPLPRSFAFPLEEFNLNEVRFRGEVPPGGRIVGMRPEVNR
ncbi:hypothetical protein VB1_CDS0062 [Arthrobacter phage Marchesin]|nr:hypothetical protein VB1_CDS0062 [Arthrobacter phage Marchesin]